MILDSGIRLIGNRCKEFQWFGLTFIDGTHIGSGQQREVLITDTPARGHFGQQRIHLVATLESG